MRLMMLVAGAALTISACNNDQAAENATNVDEDLAAQTIAANDTTSIDAAISQDANMAAEVNFTVNEADNSAAEGDSAGNAEGNAAD